ncbi:hypothetical protein ACE01N_12980 [Saccharicrinis sp. FJH2]|uniref:hypothetical protein n=1 Tax=unclassified Saccharicrinis TaxID=2646859 RepID=UPI0035D4EF61
MSELYLLLGTAAFLGFFHTATGPDHYIPFIVLSKARNWTQTRTMWITFISGVGHILGSVALGVIGIALGISLSKLELIESHRGNIVSYMLLTFGLLYTAYGIFKFITRGKHFHLPKFLVPKKIRRLQHMVTHKPYLLNKEVKVNDNTEDVTKITPWILFLIFVFGPCEVLIPLLIFPAAKFSAMGIASVSIVFGIATILTMLLVVYLGFKGTSTIKIKNGDRYFHLIAGLGILISGLGMQFFGW